MYSDTINSSLVVARMVRGLVSLFRGIEETETQIMKDNFYQLCHVV